MALDEATIADLKQKHGNELVAAESPAGDVLVFKKPSKAAWNMFTDVAAKGDGSRSNNLLTLALECVVMPDRTAAAGIFDAYPGIPASISMSLSRMVGASDTFDVKKL